MFEYSRHFLLAISTLIIFQSQAQPGQALLNREDLRFLHDMTSDVMDSSRIWPGQVISRDFGPNRSGITLVRPGGGGAYPAFWIRDYAMSIGTGMVTLKEQKEMLLFTASKQCDETFPTAGGKVPLGAIPDHIRIDDMVPIFFPGTYDPKTQGDGKFGARPPFCDQYYFIHMAYEYIKGTNDAGILRERVNGRTLMDRLEMAFSLPDAGPEGIVRTDDSTRAVDFGFRDAVQITGYLCMPSLLKYVAAREMAYCLDLVGEAGRADSCRQIAVKIKVAIPKLFQDTQGMLRASTGKSRQLDVWSTALAIFEHILEGSDRARAAKALGEAYLKGKLSHNGNIRHVAFGDDFSADSMWEFSYAAKGEYQNGGYWGTPVGWVCYAISWHDPAAARRLASEYIADLREHDYRKGRTNVAPVECFAENGEVQNPLYLTTVACPYIVFLQFVK